MSKTEVPFQLELSYSFDKLPQSGASVPDGVNGRLNGAPNAIQMPHLETPEANSDETSAAVGRRRSNSQSQVLPTPTPTRLKEEPKKRKAVQYFVTLTSLNETFIQKHLSVPYFPDTKKLGRPTGAKIKPDATNGFFDSRVLSRNHAAMYIEPNSGKLMLKDLGSSNGTFVNEKKLDKEPVEIKVGDNICFGFNIQVGINHKQINARVDNINVMSNFLKAATPDSSNSQMVDSIEYKHYQYIQDLYNKVTAPKASSQSSKPALTFEAALFSDVNPEIEDNLLGLFSKANNGIFKNSNTSSTSKLEHSIGQLLNLFAKIKQQANTLQSVETYLDAYRSKLNELNDNYINTQISGKIKEVNKQIEAEKVKRDKMSENFKYYKDESAKKAKKLEEKIWRLREERQELNKKLNAMESELQQKQALLELHTSHQKAQHQQQNVGAAELCELDFSSAQLQSQGVREMIEIDLPGTPESVQNNDIEEAQRVNGGTAADGSGNMLQNGDDGEHNDDSSGDSDSSQDASSRTPYKYDEKTDLTYKNNSLIVALLVLLLGFLAHKSIAWGT